MGANNKPQYEGLDKYPGWAATLITLVVGGVFLGALYFNAGHHGDEHHGDSSHENHDADKKPTEAPKKDKH